MPPTPSTGAAVSVGNDATPEKQNKKQKKNHTIDDELPPRPPVPRPRLILLYYYYYATYYNYYYIAIELHSCTITRVFMGCSDSKMNLRDKFLTHFNAPIFKPPQPFFKSRSQSRGPVKHEISEFR